TPETYVGRRFPSGRAAGSAPGTDEGEKRAFGALAEFCAGSAAGVCRKGHDRYQPYGGGGGSAGNRGREGRAAGKGSGRLCGRLRQGGCRIYGRKGKIFPGTVGLFS